MGIVKATWLLPSHSGRPCRHEDIYTKINKKTGKCYSVKLCNPSTKVTTDQTTQRTAFGAQNKASSAWIAYASPSTSTDHAIYAGVKAAFDRQNKYSTLRGYMLAKGIAVVQTDGSVIITIGTYSKSVINGVISSTSGGGTSY